jgi:hypothetical protein
MDNPLVIAVAHDGVAQDCNGKDRVAFEELIGVLLGYNRIPATLCFYTEGVRWVTQGSPFVEELQEIVRRGADIIACRATLAEANMIDDLAVGRLDSPDNIDDMLLEAECTMVL